MSTIGFGDLVPMVKPPDQYATFTKNDSECFNIMVDPVPSAKISEETGLYEACQEVRSCTFLYIPSGINPR